MTTFNLTRQPWIPVEPLGGGVIELSTRDCLKQAHTLCGLADPSPLVVAALTRHLLAVLHRCVDGPKEMTAWQAIAAAGAFDPARVDAYLDRVEDRMDLLHPTQPFAQTRGLSERFAPYASPIDELEIVRARWGLARALFRHRPVTPAPTMRFARAARALLAHHAFATGGLVKKPDEPTSATAAPLTRAGLVVLRGPTLFHTLVANLLQYDPHFQMPFPPSGADACAWEQSPPPKELRRSDEPKRPPLGYLDLLTWQSRRVELLHDGEQVTGFINAVGQGLAESSPRDPMVAFRRHEKYGFLPIGIDPARSFWREANALFESSRSDDAPYVRPKAISQCASVEAIEVLGSEARYDIELLGIAAEKSRVDAVRAERLRAALRSFNDGDARAAVEDALRFANEAVTALRKSLWTYARHALAPGGRDPDTNALRALVDSFGAEPTAWSALGVVFETMLPRLADDPDRAAADFMVGARDAIWNTFRSVTARPETTARWLKARALAERNLRTEMPRPDALPASPSTSEEHPSP